MAQTPLNEHTCLQGSRTVVVTADSRISAVCSVVHLCFDSTAGPELMRCLNVLLHLNVPSIRPRHLLKPAF